jgi:hypothetical protein
MARPWVEEYEKQDIDNKQTPRVVISQKIEIFEEV